MTPWVRRLLIVNVAVFFLTSQSPLLGNLLAFLPMWVLVRPWTIITYMFVHADFSHIFFNMLMVFFFGPRLEATMGSRRFITLYLAAGIAGALLSFTSPRIPIVGASGAAYGVLLAYARYWPKDTVLLMFVFPVQVRWLVIAATLMSVWFGFGQVQDGVAHFAHLGGLGGAFLYLKWLAYRSPTKQFQQKVYGDVPRGAAREADAAKRWKTINVEVLHEINRDEVIRLLAKIEAGGVASLNLEEKAFLNRFV